MLLTFERPRSLYLTMFSTQCEAGLRVFSDHGLKTCLSCTFSQESVGIGDSRRRGKKKKKEHNPTK